MGKLRGRNFDIIDTKEVPGKIARMCHKAYDKNRRFFKRDSNHFSIYISHTEPDFRKRTKRFYQPWVKGVSLKGKRVIVRSPALHKKSYEKHGGTNDQEILLTHEITHIFGSQANMHKGPYWLFEGLAMHVAGQIPGRTYKHDTNISKNRARQILFYRMMYRKLCPEMYVIHYYCTSYLIRKFGKEKLLELMNSLTKKTKKKDFERHFLDIFGLSYPAFIKDFLKYYDSKLT